MPGFNFDEYSSDDDEQEESLDSSLDAAASAIVEDLEDEDLEEQLEDVEKRLEVAQHYKLLLKGGLFNSGSEAAALVEREVKTFVKQRLRILLGLETEKPKEAPPAAAQQFTPEEYKVLQAIIGKVIRKPEVTATPEPTLRAAEVPAPAPAVRQRVVPAEAPKMQPKTVAKTPPPKPQSVKKEAPKAAPQPKKGKAKPRNLEVLQTEKGEKIVTRIDANGRKVREYVDQQGNVVTKQDLTPQVAPPGAVAMPSPQQMSVISEQQAMQSAAQTTSELGGLGAVLINTLLTQGES